MNAKLIELSERVRDHLTKQRARSIEPTGDRGCLYRAPNGDMCAVGCLIPDSYYGDWMEGRGIDDSVWDVVSKALDLDQAGFKVLSAWQRYHDSTCLNEGMCYSQWLCGDATHSPQAMHEKLLSAY